MSMSKTLTLFVLITLGAACSGGGGGGGGSVSLLAGSGESLFLGVQPTTGAATAKSGPALAGYRLWGLTFDPNSDTLYAVHGATDQLLRIDTDTGAGTAIGPFGFPGVGCLAFDSNTNRLFGVDYATDQLITIQYGNGLRTRRWTRRIQSGQRPRVRSEYEHALRRR